MSMNDSVFDQLISLQQVLNVLGDVERADYWPSSGRNRRETVIEHSYFLAAVAWHIADRLQLKLNQEKIIKYALVHDMPEAYAGDTPLFAKAEDKNNQQQREAAAIKKLTTNLPSSNITTMLAHYYDQQDDESKFIRAIDNIVAALVHITSDQTQFIDNQITAEAIDQILPKWREQTDISPEMIELTNEVLTAWWNTVTLYGGNENKGNPA